MALASVQSYLSTYQSNLWSGFSCGPTPLRCVQSQRRSSGQKAPLSLLCQGHLASLQLEHSAIFFFFDFCQTVFVLLAELFDGSGGCPDRPSFCLFWIICIDISHSSPPQLLVRGCQKHCWRKWKYPHYANAGLHWWHVLFYKLHPPLSEVKLYLSNFREIVTKISIWFACSATINLVTTNIDICLFLYKERRDRAALLLLFHNHTLLYKYILCGVLNNESPKERERERGWNKFIPDSDFFFNKIW